jgi:hypothetical protein
MTSPLEEHYEAEFRGFWLSRAEQSAKQQASGNNDAGTRGPLPVART